MGITELIYRTAIPEDEEQIRALCHKNDIAFPANSYLIVAEHGGTIVGIAGIKTELFFEPLISENPIAAVRLSERVEAAVKLSGAQRVRCLAKPNVVELFRKAGFETIENKKIIMEKEY